MGNDDSNTEVKSTTKQDNPMNNNPTGKGGFGDHPENRSPGGWKKENTFSYQYRRFMSMSIAEIDKYAQTPKDQRTVVEDLAYNRVVSARKNLKDVQEITDRTEGKAPQYIGLGGEEEYKKLLVEFIGEDGNDTTTEG